MGGLFFQDHDFQADLRQLHIDEYTAGRIASPVGVAFGDWNGRRRRRHGVQFPLNDNLFALKFTIPPSEDPDEYFREVGIDDPWIKGLLCSETTNSVNTDHRPKGIDCTDYDKS